MHGRVQKEGEGWFTNQQRFIDWHMHSTVIVADSNSFSKDGRKINVGDCALFKPTQDSPPFIGLIRQLTLSEEKNLHLGVNWLYRPAEIKLGKGTLLDSAPNEIFYSFHKDEISAACLLHPCKVAFLPKGVELPKGTPSFVCRRVYDTKKTSLFWLTDQDYINDRQEEVNQLLNKTKTEMHATLQNGGRSPKQVNGPTSTSQLKPVSDNAQQNSGISFPSHQVNKGKKRERGGDQGGNDPVKREHSSRTDDTESTMKSEIARITDKGGGVVDLEGVQKLVQLMRPDKKMDLSCRSMLAGVIAATDKVDCLHRVVQLRGLPVLDEWLQDVHKGKIGDGNSDKSVEEFLLILLRALDKLPVDLPALESCKIGRSVNHLRSNKNIEIQRKARSLVDTWKKRVEAEMSNIDSSKSSSKSRLQEASSHSGSRTPSGSTDAAAIKSSITHQHFGSKTTTTTTTTTTSAKSFNDTKSASSSPVPVKPSGSSPAASVKENYHQPSRVSVVTGSTPDVNAPLLIREDRSSSSNQSLSGKDEAKNSKISTRNRKISSSPGHRSSTALEKLSPSIVTGESGSIIDGNNSHNKLIVKIPNRVLSKEHSDTYNQGNNNPVESWQMTDSRDVLTEGDELSPPAAAATATATEVTSEDSRGLIEAKENEVKLREVSFSSSMNALIESCAAKYSEAHSSLSLDDDDDDVGMNLLASVATGDLGVSPSDSTERSLLVKEDNVTVDEEAKSKSSEEENQSVSDGVSRPEDRKDDIPTGEGSNKHFKSETAMGDHSNEKTATDNSTLHICMEKIVAKETYGEKVFPRNVGAADDKNREDLLNGDAGNKLTVEVMSSNQQQPGGECKSDVKEGSNTITHSLQERTAAAVVESECAERAIIDKCGGTRLNSETSGELKAGEQDKQDVTNSFISKVEKQNLDKETDRKKAVEENKETPLEHIPLPEKAAESTSTVAAEVSSDPESKIKFDLNEGFTIDDGPVNSIANGSVSSPFAVKNCLPSSHPTVAAAAKGPFVPPEDLLLRSKGELGWKGSAATSAFRPAEPRKAVETPLASTSKHGRVPLDIDLNVPDEGLLQEMAYQDSALSLDHPTTDFLSKRSVSLSQSTGNSMLDLDLNRLDESNDNGQCSMSSSHHRKGETSSFLQAKQFGAVDIRRDFDLNNGPPSADDTATIPDHLTMIQQVRGGNSGVKPSQLPTAGFRMNNNPYSSWFPPGNNTYSTVSMPPQRSFTPVGITSFNPDVYRGGSVLPSSPAVSFPPSPFQFPPVFPFGPNFPLPSAAFSASYSDSSSSGAARLFAPPVNSQLLGPPQFQRPYVVSLPSDGALENNNRQWGGRHGGLDLNAGPGHMENEDINTLLPSSVSSSQGGGLPEDQANRGGVYSVSGGGNLKRKEPEGGGWDNNESSFRYKQASRH